MGDCLIPWRGKTVEGVVISKCLRKLVFSFRNSVIKTCWAREEERRRIGKN